MEQPRFSPASPNARPRFRIERILFPLVFALVVLAILADKIPAVRDAKEKLLHPVEHEALKACHAAALAAAERRPAYARIVDPGEAHSTSRACASGRWGGQGPRSRLISVATSSPTARL